MDPEHYNYFRDYDPAIGRYLESDPIGLMGGTNTYLYVYSKPLSLVDREGLRDAPAGQADFDYRWKPQPGDYYPKPVDSTCFFLCIVIKEILMHGGTHAGGSAAAASGGSGSGLVRAAGAAAGAMIRGAVSPLGRISLLGYGIENCVDACEKRPQCEIPDWAKGYQNIPLPPLTAAFARR